MSRTTTILVKTRDDMKLFDKIWLEQSTSDRWVDWAAKSTTCVIIVAAIIYVIIV